MIEKFQQLPPISQPPKHPQLPNSASKNNKKVLDITSSQVKLHHHSPPQTIASPVSHLRPHSYASRGKINTFGQHSKGGHLLRGNSHKVKHLYASSSKDEQQQKQASKYISERLQAIHCKINEDIISGSSKRNGNKIKLFSDIVETKQDIDRIGRQRRFVRSLASRNGTYEEPKMPIRTKSTLASKRYKFYTQVYEDHTLNQQAKEFSERLRKVQEQLLGRCLLRRQKEEKKRELRYEREIRRNQLQRQISIYQSRNSRYKEALFANSQVIHQKAAVDECLQVNQVQQAREGQEGDRIDESYEEGAKSFKLTKQNSTNINSNRSEGLTSSHISITLRKIQTNRSRNKTLQFSDAQTSHPASPSLKASQPPSPSLKASQTPYSLLTSGKPKG